MLGEGATGREAKRSHGDRKRKNRLRHEIKSPRARSPTPRPSHNPTPCASAAPRPPREERDSANPKQLPPRSRGGNEAGRRHEQGTDRPSPPLRPHYSRRQRVVHREEHKPGGKTVKWGQEMQKPIPSGNQRFAHKIPDPPAPTPAPHPPRKDRDPANPKRLPSEPRRERGLIDDTEKKTDRPSPPLRPHRSRWRGVVPGKDPVGRRNGYTGTGNAKTDSFRQSKIPAQDPQPPRSDPSPSPTPQGPRLREPQTTSPSSRRGNEAGQQPGKGNCPPKTHATPPPLPQPRSRTGKRAQGGRRNGHARTGNAKTDSFRQPKIRPQDFRPRDPTPRSFTRPARPATPRTANDSPTRNRRRNETGQQPGEGNRPPQDPRHATTAPATEESSRGKSTDRVAKRSRGDRKRKD